MARFIALAVTIALHVGVLLLITGHWQPFPPRESRRTEPPAKAATRAPTAPRVASVAAGLDWTRQPSAQAAPGTPVAAQRIVLDLEQAREQGRALALRHRASIRRLQQRQYGDAIAALLDAPPAQAWDALEQLVREGDPVAAQALAELAAGCTERDNRARYERLADEAVQGLDPAAAAFIRAALAQEAELVDERAARCRAAGYGPARLEPLLRARGVTPGEIPVAQLMDAYDAESGPTYPGPFGELLERFVHAEPIGEADWITLLAAADEHPAVAYALGYCLQRGCAGMPELPDAERQRLRRVAAAAGNIWSARALAEDHANSGDLASAYGWLLFARWADASGCNPVATTLDLAETLRGIDSLEAVLTPGQRNAGEALGAALVAGNESNARAVWACPR